MKLIRVIFIFTFLFIPLFPQFLPKPLITSKPQVKAVSVHQINPPIVKNPFRPDIIAKAVYILDLNSDTVLFQKNADRSLYPASLTKIMTALVALDYYQLDQILTVKNADRSIGNTMNLVAGDKLTTKDLLYGLLVSSGNDAALALAENYPGGYTQFILTMNQKSASLGLKKTHFNNVSGVEDANHLTTAEEISKLTQVALQNPVFRQIVNTGQIDIESAKGNHYSLHSTNELLSSNPKVKGVKTGWTPEAGGCLITLINQNGHSVLITVLGSQDRFSETEKIIHWIQQNIAWE